MSKPTAVPQLAKKNGKKDADVQILSGLSEKENDAFQKYRTPSNSIPKAQEGKDQTVSKVKHDEEIAQLKEKIRKKDEKINDLNQTRDDLRQEKDLYKARWERAHADLETEQKKTADLREELRKANNQIDSLQKEVKTLNSQTINVKVPEAETETASKLKKSEKAVKDLNKKLEESESELAKLKSDYESLKTTVDRLNETIAGFDAERAIFEDTLALKNNEIESLKNSPELTQEQTSEIVTGEIIRRSPSELYSEMISDGRYDVKLAKDGSHMFIVPNVEGIAVCVNHCIRLPRLGDLIPFAGEVSFKLIPAGNNILRVDLK